MPLDVPVSNIIINVNGGEEVYTIANKYTALRHDVKIGDVFVIKWLGYLKVNSIIYKPYWNAINENVQEVIYNCSRMANKTVDN
jgi:hypothetical protein